MGFTPQGRRLFRASHFALERSGGANRVAPDERRFKRMIAGMPFMLTGASGPGRIAFSRDLARGVVPIAYPSRPHRYSTGQAGHVFGLHLKPGMSVDAREHQWLAATENVEYAFSRVKGAANMLLGGTGFFIDTFSCPAREGILWLHGFGNVFEVMLGLWSRAYRWSGAVRIVTSQAERRARRLTSSRAAGFTRSARCRCRRCFRGFRRVCLPARDKSSGTGSPGREKSRCNPCIATWKAASSKRSLSPIWAPARPVTFSVTFS